MKDKNMIKITSLAVVAALITSTVGAISFAAGVNSAKPAASTAAEAPAIADNEISATATDAVSSIIDESFTAGKEETVYVLASADGTVNKVIVSDWLKNPNHSQSIEDASELDNIENVKGDESYTINADNMKIWDAQGNDIYYQGTTDKALPVDVSISYKLDGKTISAENLAGKSGKLTMRFDYKNNESQTVEIDGKKQEMYVPFVMVTGMIVDDTKFSNITVSNGKVINDGDRCVIMGYALPGMQENLGLDKSKLELPDYVEITADVKDFSLTTTVTLATNDVFNSLNLDNINTAEQLKDSLDTLSSSSIQLVDGSSALYEGLATLLEKSGTLVSGVNDLYTGAGTLSAGAATLSTGATQLSTGATQLSTGTSELDTGIIALNDGLKTLNGNSKTLRDGAKQVFNSLLATADSQLKAAGLSVPKLTIENYKETLNGVIGSLNKDTIYSMAYNTALSQVTDAVNAQRPTIRAEVEKAVRRSVLEAVLAQAMPGTSVDDYMAAIAASGGLIEDESINAVEQAVEAQMATAEIQETIETNTEAKVQSLIAENMKSSDVTTKIDAAVSQAESGAGSVQALIAQLDSYKTFYDGVVAYTSGVDTAYSGSKKLVKGSAKVKEGATSLSTGATSLSSGASTLQTGADTLYGGLGTLKEGTSSLISGETELFSGSSKLADGMKEFNEKGIKKLVEAVDGDIDVLITRIRAMVDVSKDYQSFGGKSEDVNGTVKFIYRTDSIE